MIFMRFMFFYYHSLCFRVCRFKQLYLGKHSELYSDIYIYIYIYPTRCKVTQFIYFYKLLYMFRVVPPPIIRSTYNCIYRIWYLSSRYCYLSLSWRSWNWFQFQVLHDIVGYISECTYDARTPER